jgi:arsenite methyltransferase
MGADDPDRFFGYNVTPIRDLAAKIETLYECIQPHGRDPMGDFDERDLVRQAEQAGFPEVDLELRVSVKNARRPMTWEGFLRMSGNPLIPAFGEAIDRTLSPQEADVFARHLRPLVESGNGVERMAMAYLTAAKI